MIVYVTCRNFMRKTFILVTEPRDKVARLRSQLMHILHEIGHEKHQFRLRLHGQYIRDTSTLADCNIADNSVIHMVTTSVHTTENSQTHWSESVRRQGFPKKTEIVDDVYTALHKEIRVFDSRENWLKNFKALLYLLCLLTVFAAFSVHWYAVFWTGVLALMAVTFCPTYTRVGGYVGNNTLRRNGFCYVYGVTSVVVMAVALGLSIFYWVKITNHGCKDFAFEGDCSSINVYTAVYFSVQALVILLTSVLAWILLRNFRYEIGDFIEGFLMRERNMADILQTTRSYCLNDKRSAAIELAAVASTDNDDDKFRVVAEGGLDALISLTLSQDTQTQEHAIEALLNLITIPAIRDGFIELGGIHTATALLNSTSLVAMETAARVLYIITSECGDRCVEVVRDHGLDDLCHATLHGSENCQQLLASIYLELAFDADVRDQMASRNSPARALTHLCRSENIETLRYSLQALELLALSSPDLLTSQESLLDVLMSLTSHVHDDKVSLLVAKTLLYFAESTQACERLLYQKHLKSTLSVFANIPDVVVQQVILQIISAFINNVSLRIPATELGLGDIVEYLRENAINRDIWTTADLIVQSMTKGEAIPSSKVSSRQQFGSRSSLTSATRRQTLQEKIVQQSV